MKPLFILSIALLSYNNPVCKAQDPALPATNLGLANMQDGTSPGPGLYYIQYLQVYQPSVVKDPKGATQQGPRVSSVLSMHQLVYEFPLRVLDGHLAFSMLVPLVKLSVSDDGKRLSVNPGINSGLIFGPVIQWSGKHLFSLPYAHRVELDLSVPAGAYSDKYDINPSSRLFTLSAYYAFTLSLPWGFGISTRNIFNYNFRKINTGIRPGMFYSINFSFEKNIYKTLNAEIAGYFLRQLSQDTYYGDAHYYQDIYGIMDTREQILGLAPGLSYVVKGGLALELKVFFETAGKNRTEGLRPTFRMAYRLN